MEQQENKNYKEVYKVKHRQHLLSMLVSVDEGIKKHWEEANNLQMRYVDRTFPWLDTSPDANKSLQKSVEDMSKQWAKVWGNPDDPATQKKMWQTIKAMNPRAEIPAEYR